MEILKVAASIILTILFFAILFAAWEVIFVLCLIALILCVVGGVAGLIYNLLFG